MSKHLILIILLFCSTICFGQADEKEIKQTSKEIKKNKKIKKKKYYSVTIDGDTVYGKILYYRSGAKLGPRLSHPKAIQADTLLTPSNTKSFYIKKSKYIIVADQTITYDGGLTAPLFEDVEYNILKHRFSGKISSYSYSIFRPNGDQTLNYVYEKNGEFVEFYHYYHKKKFITNQDAFEELIKDNPEIYKKYVLDPDMLSRIAITQQAIIKEYNSYK